MSSSQRPEPTWSARSLIPRSLSARLLITTLVLIALVSTIVVAVTTLALRHFLLEQVDQQLVEAVERHDAAGPGGIGGIGGIASYPRHFCAAQDAGFVQATDTVIGRFGSYCHSAVELTDNGEELRLLNAQDTQALSELKVSNSPHNVSLSLGSYRVVVAPDVDGRFVTGLPTGDVTRTVDRVLVWELLVAAAALLLAAAGGQALVRRQLAPLRRVASTAREVTQMPLGTGAVGVTARVPNELTDVSTEVGQVGSALNAMLGHVEGALAARHASEQRVRQFVADASHELRTPLSTISGYAELSQRPGSDEVAMAHAMDRIESESARMTSLVNDLLLLARLDSGRPLERQPVDLSLLLAESVNDARVVGVDHEWRLRLPEQPLTVPGDSDRLQQVFANLLANARRHTPERTAVTVSASPVPAEGQRPAGVNVEVADNGPGFPSELAGKEFERFSRGDSSRTRSSGGTGLGLSIVAAIVGAHHGTVSLRSRPGSTTIRVWLPMSASGPAPGVPPAGREKANAQPPIPGD